MWIREVDFPQALIDDHQSGRVVLFVGAGASVDAPSNLPSFWRLAKAIAEDVGVTPSESDLVNLDRFLGSLMDRGIDVHRQVYERISDANSHPNGLHTALVGLALAGTTVRIVTTNYDQHLSAVLHDRGVEFDEYVCPALPMGDDFSGVVYLHGRLSQRPDQLIVTDRDFGRAYLRDAWAARFLERMFASFTVLFVGYSHDDVVMRYLARALGPVGARYIMTHDPESAKWKPLGLTPIGYTVADGSHAALGEAITGWASWSSMGLLDHRQRVEELVSGPVPQIPEEVSYLESVCADFHQVKLFTQLARGEQWLRWLTTHHEFRRLFDRSAQPNECTFALAQWLVDQFVVDEELSPAALRVVQEAGGQLGETLCSRLGFALHVGTSPRPQWLNPWVVLLARDGSDHNVDWLEYLLAASQWPPDRAAILFLFDRLTQPTVAPRPSFRASESIQFEVQLPGSAHGLREAWISVIRPHLADVAADVLAIVDRHLRAIRLQLTLTGSAGERWDPVSFGRSAIEAHEQDAHPGPIDVLVDAARDCLLTLVDNDPTLASGYLSAWANADAPVLRRLAVHAWAHRKDVDASAKISWIRARGWLYDRTVHHEVYGLLAQALPAADQTAIDALVNDVEAGPEYQDNPEHHAYQRFRLLYWITQHLPNHAPAKQALDSLRSTHPSFAAPSHPDLLAWHSIGKWESTPPMSADDLHADLNADAATSMANLLAYQSVSLPGDQHTWVDTLDVISAVVHSHPDDGRIILAVDGDLGPDIPSAVIRGWSSATLSSFNVTMVLGQLSDLDLSMQHEAIADLLKRGGADTQNPTEWHTLDAARSLATDLWHAIPTDPSDSEADDWLTRAINTSAGKLAIFWIEAIAADWKEAKEAWSGIPDPLRIQLNELIGSNDPRSIMAEIIIASQIHFLHAADAPWTEQHVLPLLSWSDAERAFRTWNGYLTWGRWNDQLLSAGLLDSYLEAARHIGNFPDRHAKELREDLASVALYGSFDPLSWLRRLTAAVDSRQLAKWVDGVSWRLEELPLDTVEDQWQRWMRRYWQNRLASPLPLTIEEASAMTVWVYHLTDSLADGVDLATQHSAHLGQHARALRAITDEKAANSPAAYATLIAHLVTTTPTPCHGCCDQLRRLAPILRNGASATDIALIREHGLRLGCPDAHAW